MKIYLKNITDYRFEIFTFDQIKKLAEKGQIEILIVKDYCLGV